MHAYIHVISMVIVYYYEDEYVFDTRFTMFKGMVFTKSAHFESLDFADSVPHCTIL
jgi:hypothetical protein